MPKEEQPGEICRIKTEGKFSVQSGAEAVPAIVEHRDDVGVNSYYPVAPLWRYDTKGRKRLVLYF